MAEQVIQFSLMVLLKLSPNMKKLFIFAVLVPICVMAQYRNGPYPTPLTPASLVIAGGLLKTTNTILLASSGVTYTNLYTAWNAAIDGDTIFVGAGTYNEGNNICNPQNNLSIVPLGTANLIISLANGASVVDAPHIYMKPGNNLHVYPGLVITETTSNQFNAIFGTPTNQVTATNWFVDGLIARHCDSDGFYWSHSNSITIQGTTRFCRIQGYWDTDATAGSAQNKNLFSTNNTTIVHEDFDFNCNFINGIIPAVRRGINITAGNFIYRRGAVTMNAAGGQNIGALSLGTNSAITLQDVKFNVSGSGYKDIDTEGQVFVLDGGTVSVNTGWLTINNPSQLVIGLQSPFGTPITPTPVSDVNLAASFDYWTAKDVGDFGSIYIIPSGAALGDFTAPFSYYQGGYSSNGGTNQDRNVNAKAGVHFNFAGGDGGGWTNIQTAAIMGVSGKIPTAVILTGSVFTFSNSTPAILECYFSGSVAYAVAKNGVTVFGSLAADGYLLLQPTNKVAITYTVAPTMFTNSLF